MQIEIHLIQNFAPSNLNRDDTGSPKDCEFGGYRRARVSSQCWKRAVREHFQDAGLFPPEQLAVRSRRLAAELASLLAQSRPSASPADCAAVAASALKTLGVSLSKDNEEETRTSVLLFLGRDQIDTLAARCLQHWDELLAAAGKKKDAKLPKEVVSALKDSLNASRAVDLALFGRMIAEDPDRNVDAACQVAHAISTHKVSVEFDYFTAVDDLGRKEDTGAGMLGTQEFNSACFYRYANINFPQLLNNLQGDRPLALRAVRAFLQSFIVAIPKAKQNSSAAQCLPAFVMVVVRSAGLWSLANAFAEPARVDGKGLIANSIAALSAHWQELTALYGASQISATHVACGDGPVLGPLQESRRTSVEEVISAAVVALG